LNDHDRLALLESIVERLADDVAALVAHDRSTWGAYTLGRFIGAGIITALIVQTVATLFGNR